MAMAAPAHPCRCVSCDAPAAFALVVFRCARGGDAHPVELSREGACAAHAPERARRLPAERMVAPENLSWRAPAADRAERAALHGLLATTSRSRSSPAPAVRWVEVAGPRLAALAGPAPALADGAWPRLGGAVLRYDPACDPDALTLVLCDGAELRTHLAPLPLGLSADESALYTALRDGGAPADEVVAMVRLVLAG